MMNVSSGRLVALLAAVAAIIAVVGEATGTVITRWEAIITAAAAAIALLIEAFSGGSTP